MNFLSNYDDSSSSDELEVYHDNIEFKVENKVNKCNKKRTIEQLNTDDSFNTSQNDLPELPAFLQTLKEDKEQMNNYDSKKLRIFQHVEGNFATFVYLKVPIGRTDLRDQINEINNYIKSNSKYSNYEIFNVDNYHISLSRTFPIREHHIDSLEVQLKSTLENQNSFEISLDQLCYFTNEIGSRAFFSLLIDQGKSEVLSLISKIDEALSLFGFPNFHSEPEPHLSLFWCSLIKSSNPTNRESHIKEEKDVEDDEEEGCLMENKTLLKSTLDNKSNLIKINKIYWMVGKREYSIDLH
ncbi:UPF0406 family protein [Tieghemostelium lacteum]|uniref:U6 snRNA phosphodiesterase 1 n=1 Tax=Tieghemostelium lacteum TaxID=361077 RepID=A0A152A3B7_TIELA|nr:UPF0406 family protein [Tieghemostelium lacteum]|eukprot:KYR00694.1 UPF0406 family protein [Tieghemostelium lacteum]